MAKYIYDPSEYEIHKSFVDYVKKVHPNIFPLLIHIPNEGKRTSKGFKAQELLGYKPGCPDIFIAKPVCTPKCFYGGLWIEFKRKDGKLSAKQDAFCQLMLETGYAVGVAYTIDSAIMILEDYIK